jgi:putative peptide zinc metalloprotease protein
MQTVRENPLPYALAPLKVSRLDVALDEPRYVVTLGGPGKNFILAPKLIDLIAQIGRGGTIEEASRALSVKWGRPFSPDDLHIVVEQQLLPRGIVRRAADEPVAEAAGVTPAPQKSLRARLLTGEFYWPLIGGKRVGKICSPLTALYEPASTILAAILILATRWILYSSVDRHFSRQLMTEFAPGEYLVTLALLLAVILFHEFGHAAAQLRFGLPVGFIGFQLQYYVPAFFADVSASWRLNPARRMAVDAGGIYFQSIAASALYLLYLQTHYQPLLAAIISSDSLCVVALIPFMKLDGYWLLADALAVPNLQALSDSVRGHYWRRLTGREAGAAEGPPVGGWRAVAVAAYGIVKYLFWGFAVLLIMARAPLLFLVASAVIRQSLAHALAGVRSLDALLVLSSLLKLTLFILLLLATCMLIGGMALKLWQAVRSGVGRLLSRRAPRAALGSTT